MKIGNYVNGNAVRSEKSNSSSGIIAVINVYLFIYLDMFRSLKNIIVYGRDILKSASIIVVGENQNPFRSTVHTLFLINIES